MPQVIPIALGAAGAIAGTGTFLGLTATAWAVASLGASLLVGNYEARKAQREERKAYNAAQVDRLVNVATTAAPRDLVLGRVRKGGAVYFRGSAGYYKERFLAHLALAGHEIDAVEQIYLDDQPVSLDSNGYVTTAPYLQQRKVSATVTLQPGVMTATLAGAPIDGTLSVMWVPARTEDGSYVGGDVPRALSYSLAGLVVTLNESITSGTTQIGYQYNQNLPMVRVWWELGSPNAVADARTRELFPDLWTENHRAQGVAKLVAEFVFDDGAFPKGAVPNLTALIRGAKAYDPRTGLTQWTDNPAILARHVYTHQFFGKATCSSSEDARFIAAANACDTTYPFVVAGGTDTQKLYRASLVAEFGTPASAVLDDLAQAMAGGWLLTSELYIRAGVSTVPVKSLFDADLAVVQRNGDKEEREPVAITVHRARNDLFNVVNPTIWDAGQDYKQVVLTPVRGAALIARDGQELSHDMSLPAVFFAPQAQHVAGVIMRDARDALTVEAPFKLTAYPLEVFDVVQLTLDRYGWTNKLFMVVKRQWMRERGVVMLTLKETSAAIFQPDASFLAQGYASNTSLPLPWQITPPAITVTSGTSDLAKLADGTVMTRVRVSWPPLLDQSIAQGGKVEVQWSADAVTWQAEETDGLATQLYLVGPADGQLIYLRARTKNSVAVSDWSLQVAHVVVGKTQAPTDVATLAVDLDGIASWPIVPDADVRSGGGYRLRWQPGNNRSWGDASPLHDGLITQSPYPILVRPAGPATIMIKSVDSSGNEALNATPAVVNLGDPLVENVVTSLDYRAAGFPGTIVNATVSGGNLVADADPLPLAWDPNPNTAGWTLDTDPGWTPTTYKPITYTPDVLIVTAADDGAQLTLQHAISGIAFLIAYRRDGDYPGWTSDAEPGWTNDADPGWVTEEFRPWPGTVTAREGRYEFQITTQSRDVQSVISQLAAQLDVPDLFENVGEVVIAPGGTVIPATKPFRAVTGVGLTLLSDGGTAVNARVESTATRTVTTRDASDVSVAGKVLATLQGY